MNHYEVIDGVRHFDYWKTIHFLNDQGKRIFGNHFKIDKEDITVINRLILYAAHVEDQCEENGIDLKKGILLTGPIGCGKTSWMKLIQSLMLSNQKYQVKSAREIAFEFNKDGFSVINNYGNRNSRICLDDIGVEQNIKFFGNECNTIAEILLFRYELHSQQGIITHATTNLNASQLEQLYGNRVRSRLRSMFNLVSFPESSRDKRK
jgi:DNA replication protein DnaC